MLIGYHSRKLAQEVCNYSITGLKSKALVSNMHDFIHITETSIFKIYGIPQSY